jgi:hypothetical protein
MNYKATLELDGEQEQVTVNSVNLADDGALFVGFDPSAIPREYREYITFVSYKLRAFIGIDSEVSLVKVEPTLDVPEPQEPLF